MRCPAKYTPLVAGIDAKSWKGEGTTPSHSRQNLLPTAPDARSPESIEVAVEAGDHVKAPRLHVEGDQCIDQADVLTLIPVDRLAEKSGAG